MRNSPLETSNSLLSTSRPADPLATSAARADRSGKSRGGLCLWSRGTAADACTQPAAGRHSGLRCPFAPPAAQAQMSTPPSPEDGRCVHVACGEGDVLSSRSHHEVALARHACERLGGELRSKLRRPAGAPQQQQPFGASLAARREHLLHQQLARGHPRLEGTKHRIGPRRLPAIVLGPRRASLGICVGARLTAADHTGAARRNRLPHPTKLRLQCRRVDCVEGKSHVTRGVARETAHLAPC